MTEEPLWTVKDAAAYLNVSHMHVWRLLERGKLPVGFKVGRCWRFEPEALKMWVRLQTKPDKKRAPALFAASKRRSAGNGGSARRG